MTSSRRWERAPIGVEVGRLWNHVPCVLRWGAVPHMPLSTAPVSTSGTSIHRLVTGQQVLLGCWTQHASWTGSF